MTVGNQHPACFHATCSRLIAPLDSQLFLLPLFIFFAALQLMMDLHALPEKSILFSFVVDWSFYLYLYADSNVILAVVHVAGLCRFPSVLALALQLLTGIKYTVKIVHFWVTQHSAKGKLSDKCFSCMPLGHLGLIVDRTTSFVLNS